MISQPKGTAGLTPAELSKRHGKGVLGVRMSELHPAEYRAWGMMRHRCSNPNAINYHRYGGRGIRVCPEWASFAGFFADMGERPSAKHSIDRIDNDGDYTKANCRWATFMEQQRNRSRLVIVLRSDGVRFVTCVDAAASVGAHVNTFRKYLASGRPFCGYTWQRVSKT